MKIKRLPAWLLVIAMLFLACPALGEAPEIEWTDDAAELPAELELAAGEDLPELVEPGQVELDLSGLELSDDLSDALESAPEADAGVNANAAVHPVGSYMPRGGLDNDALFAGYVDMLFGKADALGLKPNGWAGDRLTGVAADVYKYLLAVVQKVASGSISDTRVYIPGSVVPDSSVDAALEAIPNIIDVLLVDCPYQLFWYDKTSNTRYGYENGVYIFFPVAQEYATGTYSTNVDLIITAHAAVSRAKGVVKKYAGASDYDKLCGYRDFICDAVEYNDDAAADANWPYGNPWQLIWAFDGDPATNIVCEGYAKAFQYLCDLSSFSSAIQCHIVTGYAQDSQGGGAHMWNVVTMGDGKNYHVDVTFVDSGFTVAFLCGAAKTQNENTYLVANEVYYTFDSDTVRVYPARTLKLSTRAYDPAGSEEEPEEPGDGDDSPTDIAIVQGKSATLYMGNKLTLEAALMPTDSNTPLTWHSSKRTVATVSKSGVVTPKKAGTTRITVTTGNNLSATITVRVVDATGVKLRKGSKVLKKGQKINLARGKSLTLKGVVSPAKVKTKLTWKSSYKYVTVKNGKVTVNKKAKAGTRAKITVRTANGKSTYLYIVVK